MAGKLTPEQYHVTREAGTERAFSGPYWDDKTPGIYHCICCDTLLFDADTKYDSGTAGRVFSSPCRKTPWPKRQITHYLCGARKSW